MVTKTNLKHINLLTYLYDSIDNSDISDSYDSIDSSDSSTKLKNSNCDKTQYLKLWHTS